MDRKKVLIVDDQSELRKLIRMTLDLGDYKLFEADFGLQALELAKDIEPDLVVLDVMMPGDLNGYEVCAKLKNSERNKVPYVILLTAKGQEADIDEGRKAGADHYLVKPFSPLELIEKVKNALG
ncbi:response regulator transcription factor [Vibrio sp. MA40-2]|uniref:response regulator transcription factor n=1 Tax=Vibrio sp. MA40-2 TaxID=3391828 RepID=UPI0039A5A06A